MRDNDAALLTAHSLRIDRMTGEVVSSLREAGIRTVLLKGPGLARRLYADGGARPYVDSDLLVEPRSFAAAEAVLRSSGFVRTSDEESELPQWAWHHHGWGRPGTDLLLELHWTLMHVGATPEHVWRAFRRGTEQMHVGGVAVDVPGEAQLALQAALHVAEHGPVEKPYEDLARAIRRLGFETWVEASQLAGELEAGDAFAAALRMQPAGRELADRLGLAPGGVEAFALRRVARAGSWRAKGRLAAAIAFPEPEHMRAFGGPLARRGRLGLVAAYACRPISLAVRAPRAWTEMRATHGDDG